MQVVNFQMGSYDPPGTDAPPWRVNTYGRYTINLGIFSPEMRTLSQPEKKYDWINEYDCQMRRRIGNFSRSGGIPGGR